MRPPRDHPRVCGEKTRQSKKVKRIWGSPPRMRGKGSELRRLHAERGITPAYAGKSFVCCPRLLFDLDHPRMCGEKLFDLTAKVTDKGSPPRVRGKVILCGQDEVAVGITPACAGKRTRPRRWVRPPRDHPRACGEKPLHFFIQVSGPGSPPRMRGKAAGVFVLCPVCRITPAHAGKSGKSRLHDKAVRDHPRACGEKLLPLSVQTATRGSPPRMRGKGVLVCQLLRVLGITPAHAGKRMTKDFTEERLGDHPRACGEKAARLTGKEKPRGSPPRMRGKD